MVPISGRSLAGRFQIGHALAQPQLGAAGGLSFVGDLDRITGSWLTRESSVRRVHESDRGEPDGVKDVGISRLMGRRWIS